MKSLNMHVTHCLPHKRVFFFLLFVFLCFEFPITNDRKIREVEKCKCLTVYRQKQKNSNSDRKKGENVISLIAQLPCWKG